MIKTEDAAHAQFTGPSSLSPIVSALDVASEALCDAHKEHCHYLAKHGPFCSSDWKEHMTQKAAELIATKCPELRFIDTELLVQYAIDVTEKMDNMNLGKWFRSVRDAVGAFKQVHPLGN